MSVRATVHPGGFRGGETIVPGDKSIAHRWLILAGIADGWSELTGLPTALDVRSTARCVGALFGGDAGVALEGWASEPRAMPDGDRSTRNGPRPRGPALVVEAHGRETLQPPERNLDCGNSGTTMRLLAGVLAAAPFETVLEGDDSLSMRPMERVATPLRSMGADVETTGGHAPLRVRGGRLRGIEHRTPVPTAQVKSAVLLAGLEAEGETTVRESAQTRDHTERALEHLGAPIRISTGSVTVASFRPPGFAGSVPGDVSSAAFLIAAAALAGRPLWVRDVGLNPTRTGYLGVLERMGVRTHLEVEREELGEPVGSVIVDPCGGLVGTTVEPQELPLVVDEVPVLALLAAHAAGDTCFARADELRLKESDRLAGVAEAISSLGGVAAVEGDDLVVGGGGLSGGVVDARGDHRMAMAIAVSAIAARGPVTIEGIEAAEVTFPGFVPALVALGAWVEG
jgi:3-phosphoshikimate 1-carboxyvinyltransferase